MENEYVEEVGEIGQDVGNNTTENENVINEDVELSEEQSETTENMDINNNVDNIPIVEEVTEYTVSLSDEQYSEINGYLKIISHAEVISITFLLSILIYMFIHNMLERRKI